MLDNPNEQQLAYKPLENLSPTNNTPYIQLKDYNPNWVEWASQRFTQIRASKTSSGIIYTVPDGNIFYITSCFITIRAGAVAGDNGILLDKENVYLLIASAAANSSSSNSISFSSPLRIPAASTISFDESASGVAGFTGFLVPFSV